MTTAKTSLGAFIRASSLPLLILYKTKDELYHPTAHMAKTLSWSKPDHQRKYHSAAGLHSPSPVGCGAESEEGKTHGLR